MTTPATPRTDAAELTVHQDTTINATRLSVVLSVGGIAAIIGASLYVGRYAERMDRLEKDLLQRATISEVSELRRTLEAVQQGQVEGQAELRADIRSVRDLLIERIQRGGR